MKLTILLPLFFVWNVAVSFKTPTKTAWDPTEYLCSVCDAVFDQVLSSEKSFQDACSHYNVCNMLDENMPIIGGNARASCQAAGICPTNERWQSFNGSLENGLDIRISKAYGARGNEKIRVSVISNYSLSGDFFTYSEQFKYRWTQYFLNTALVDVTPGQINEVHITDDEVFSVYVPAADEGTRGVIIADPCFQSQWIICFYQNRFDTFNRLTSLLNSVNKHDDVHYWMILGLVINNHYMSQRVVIKVGVGGRGWGEYVCGTVRLCCIVTHALAPSSLCK